MVLSMKNSTQNPMIVLSATVVNGGLIRRRRLSVMG